MPLVFKTREDSNEAVELVGVGVLPAGGAGGLPVAEAARRGFEPLLQHDPDTGFAATNDDGSPAVLEGAALAAAAKRWADTHGGVVAVNVSETALAKLHEDSGLPPVLHAPDARTAAEQDYVRAVGRTEVVLNADPDANAAGLADPEANPETATTKAGGDS